MTEDEAYKVHIQYTFNAFCKIVIRHAAIDKILKLRRRWEREVSLDYDPQGFEQCAATVHKYADLCAFCTLQSEYRTLIR